MGTDFDPVFSGPMRVVFARDEPEDGRRRDSLFGLGNGVLFFRACPPEAAGDAHHYAGTYYAGCYDDRIVTIDGRHFGHASLVNLPNPVPLTFRFGDGDWFSPAACHISYFEYALDLDRCITERTLVASDVQGRRFHLLERRLVSMARPHLAAIRWEVCAEEWSGPITFKSWIEGGVSNANTDHRFLSPYRHLSIDAAGTEGPLTLSTHTNQADAQIAVATRAGLNIPASRLGAREGDAVEEYLTASVAAGSPVILEKIIAIAVRESEALTAVVADLSEATDFAGLEAEHAAAWRELWQRAAIQADNPWIAEPLAFHIFQVLQAVSPLSLGHDTGLPSRGWQEAYHGQIFWDDVFLLPFFNHRFPEISRHLLMYRCRRLRAAKQAAREAGFAGAMFAWRSANSGAEETPAFQFNSQTARWAADQTFRERHIGAIIAHNIWQYWLATGDDEFLTAFGFEMLVEIARFWASFVREAEADGRYDIVGVVGPDEYHTAYPGAAALGITNNAYTNVMAAAALLHAADAADLMIAKNDQALLDALCITPAEAQQWRAIASRIRLCFFGDGILSQFEGFEKLRPLDGAAFSEANPNGRLDQKLEADGDDINNYQAAKQADVLTLFYFFRPEQLIALIGTMGYEIDVEALRRTAAYYLKCATHESSLSHVVCAGALAALDLDTSWEFFQRTLLIDFRAEQSASAGEGLHIGAMAGTLDILQRHYLGLHLQGGALYLEPRMPPAVGTLTMMLTHRGQQLIVGWDGFKLGLTAPSANTGPVCVIHRRQLHRVAPGRSLALPEPMPSGSAPSNANESAKKGG